MISNLPQRIRKGAAWLHLHGSGNCEKYDISYDHARYVKNLKLYQGLVDQAVAQGLSEKEILHDKNLTAQDMSVEEILKTMTEVEGVKLTWW